MIEVRVAQEDVDVVRLQILWNAKERCTCIEDDADFRNHHASGVTILIRMVTGSAEDDELHLIMRRGSLVVKMGLAPKQRDRLST